jgi:uncharacterized protein (UPF0333 family)
MRQRGQASVELLAAIPALLLAALVAAQLLVTAYTLHLADGAAEAGALALAAGAEAEPAARASLPGWARDRISVSAAGGRVEVTVRPPAPLAGLAAALEITSSAWARPDDG